MLLPTQRLSIDKNNKRVCLFVNTKQAEEKNKPIRLFKSSHVFFISFASGVSSAGASFNLQVYKDTTYMSKITSKSIVTFLKSPKPPIFSNGPNFLYGVHCCRNV